MIEHFVCMVRSSSDPKSELRAIELTITRAEFKALKRALRTEEMKE